MFILFTIGNIYLLSKAHQHIKSNHVCYYKNIKPTAMLLSLPFDLQDKIYGMLSVKDRVRLNMCLPKQNRDRYKPLHEEKKLGVISIAIQKKRIKKLTPQMKAFLTQKVSRKDPTFAELVDVFPELVPGQSSGQLTLEAVKDMDHTQVMDVLKKARPSEYDIISTHRMFEDEFQRISILFHCLLYNHAMFRFLVSSGKMDVNMLRSSLIFTTHNVSNAKLVLEYMAASKEELEEMYVKAMGDMHIDVAEFLDAKIKAMDGPP